YDRELTGPRTLAWLLMGQAARLMWFKAQLPAESLGNEWIRAICSKLGNSTTFGLKTLSSQLSFTRASSIGLTSDEIHLLADWLESPHFPTGLHTFEAPSPHKPGTAKPSQEQLPPK